MPNSQLNYTLPTCTIAGPTTTVHWHARAASHSFFVGHTIRVRVTI